jgi:hypothetical protein
VGLFLFPDHHTGTIEQLPNGKYIFAKCDWTLLVNIDLTAPSRCTDSNEKQVLIPVCWHIGFKAT